MIKKLHPANGHSRSGKNARFSSARAGSSHLHNQMSPAETNTTEKMAMATTDHLSGLAALMHTAHIFITND